MELYYLMSLIIPWVKYIAVVPLCFLVMMVVCPAAMILGAAAHVVTWASGVHLQQVLHQRQGGLHNLPLPGRTLNRMRRG